MKYHINIDKEIIQSLLNSSAEINVMLYHIALKLKLVIQSNIVIVMKNVRNLKLSFIKYISDVTIRIENVIIKQSFFILEKNSNACILDQFFETIMCMIKQTLNDELVHVIIFDLENDSIQTIFQAYALSDVNDCYEYQVIEINIIQSIRKHLNMIHST